MNKYIQKLNRIEFVITNSCSGKCKHCSQGEHTSSEHIDEDKAVQAVYDICAHYNITSLMTFGGEPLLYPETVCKIHSAAKKNNIPYRELITNGYFSKKPDRIQEVTRMLAESGVNKICLSVDAFHQETIPLEYVTVFAKLIKETGIVINTHPAWLVSKKDNNPYNNRTREILEEFKGIGIYPTEGNVIFPGGNALKYLGEYFKDTENAVHPYSENPEDIKAVCFSANGDILNGNIYKNDILDIIDSYDI